MAPTNPLKVLIPLHPGFDVMDFFGPLEILCCARTSTISQDTENSSPRAFEALATSETPLVTSEQGIKIAQSIPLEEAYQCLSEFDILVIPGGASATILKPPGAAEPMGIIKAFASLPARPSSSSERVIMSVCTGSLFLASAGVLVGQTVTTNTQMLHRLRAMSAGAETKVVEHGERFVVNPVGGVQGVGLPGYRIVTSAGPGAGLDLSLWIVEYYCGKDTRKYVEDLVEYTGRLGDGLILG